MELEFLLKLNNVNFHPPLAAQQWVEEVVLFQRIAIGTMIFAIVLIPVPSLEPVAIRIFLSIFSGVLGLSKMSIQREVRVLPHVQKVFAS